MRKSITYLGPEPHRGALRGTQENGVILVKKLEQHFDKGNIVIISASEDEERLAVFKLRTAISGWSIKPVLSRRSR